ncbi:MAG TPA: metallophosphoesterase family protein [Bryobacterales bacterium]|nr:metallophosphoesterase family protein [Bryobacterales bacterium]
MRYLVVSDIHANWEALQAVLEDAKGKYKKIICLGDIVGYGADPNPVTEWVRDNVANVIRGNHDKVCCGLEDPVLFNAVAEKAARWTLEQLTPKNRDFLRGLPKGPVEEDGFLMVHGSVLDEDEYLLDPRDTVLQFANANGKPVFFGHTHVQGGFLLWPAGKKSKPAAFEPDAHEPNGSELKLRPGRGQLVNPGSVGQPRDLNPHAAYALYNSKSGVVEFRRCQYDLATAQKKIRDAGLPPALADRLALGR